MLRKNTGSWANAALKSPISATGTCSSARSRATWTRRTPCLSCKSLPQICSPGRRFAPETLRDNLLHTIACKAAIKAGWHTEGAEAAHLVAEILSRTDIKYCPHGRPVCIELTKSQLERQFKRS